MVPGLSTQESGPSGRGLQVFQERGQWAALFPPRPGSTEGWPLQLKDPVVSVSVWTFPWGGTSGREIRLEKFDADMGHRDTGMASLAH